MFDVDVIEVLLGTLGVASSIYEPWIGDTRASILVTFARMASLCTLFALVLFALAILIPFKWIEVDSTIAAILFFAVGASAPTLARGAWSLIDMATMFNDMVYLSYQHQPELTGSGRACNVDSMGVLDFAAWFCVVFWTLMKHNVSWERLTPYGPNLYRAFRNNWETVVHGRSIHPKKICWAHAWKYGCGGWASRAKAFLNIVVLDVLGFVFLLLQAMTALVEGFLLTIGSFWLSVAIAAQANGLAEDEHVAPTRVLNLVVEELICCETCTHKKHDRAEGPAEHDRCQSLSESDADQRRVGNDTEESQAVNTKSYEELMPQIKKKSMKGRNGRSINVCECRFCTLGLKGGWVDPPEEGDFFCRKCKKNDEARSSDVLS